MTYLCYAILILAVWVGLGLLLLAIDEFLLYLDWRREHRVPPKLPPLPRRDRARWWWF